MPSVISLKDIRSNSTIKEQLRKVELEKQDLEKQLDFQKKVESKLREDIAENKKDFEHLEKQFVHFAGLEAEFDELQQQLQMERLEKLVETGKSDDQSTEQLDKARAELKQTQDELKELKKLDPHRLKRQVTDLKKKSATQATENKNINKALVSARKELREMTSEKEKTTRELEACRKGLDYFWQSEDKEWVLYETDQRLMSDKDGDNTIPTAVKCLHTGTGQTWLSREIDADGKAVWMAEGDIPEAVTTEAGKRHNKIAADAEKAAKKA